MKKVLAVNFLCRRLLWLGGSGAKWIPSAGCRLLRLGCDLHAIEHVVRGLLLGGCSWLCVHEAEGVRWLSGCWLLWLLLSRWHRVIYLHLSKHIGGLLGGCVLWLSGSSATHGHTAEHSSVGLSCWKLLLLLGRLLRLHETKSCGWLLLLWLSRCASRWT